mmetsp:Transcript_10703/g.26596  ORF Transcript_10703/g.26596 Transcript_10703/m.26596 type:complete len:329 (-) Transcript_10703:226-1212(-)|eukprot:CAMPEP_0115201874 /NCGR_PEP_ID=MMETSP0270-20121206/17845_1 /TAXON_ID=71861 /ORGANISM="Scrippsiella trochoidea, Strain CCMP3099" /LENGTH=328 /DNA_ID=CAMNT_0002615289 /DNA_START=78 /DNA_END=1064 /DNA_ORIENTATION=-
MTVGVNDVPTLSCSRPEPWREHVEQRRRPAPAPLDALEEPVENTLPALRVKNTFLEVDPQSSLSLEHVHQVPAMHTCPSKQSGFQKSLLQEAVERAARSDTEVSTTPPTTPSAIGTPCSIETQLFDEETEAYTSQQSYESSPAFPSFAVPVQVFFVPVLQYGEADSAWVPVQEGHCASWQVLSSAGALEPGVVSAQKASMSDEPELLMHDHGDLRSDSHRPTDGQTWNAIEDFFVSSSCISSPPPPPPCPALGADELPSVGSRDHAAGHCRPCAFLHTKGCETGPACKFCHLCSDEDRKRRRKERFLERREVTRARKARQKARAEASA